MIHHKLPECHKDMEHIISEINHLNTEISLKLDKIIEQTTRTNGRVNKLEDQVERNTKLVDKFDNQVSKNTDKIVKIEEQGSFWFWVGRNWSSIITAIGVISTLIVINIKWK